MGDVSSTTTCQALRGDPRSHWTLVVTRRGEAGAFVFGPWRSYAAAKAARDEVYTYLHPIPDHDVALEIEPLYGAGDGDKAGLITKVLANLGIAPEHCAECGGVR